VAPVPSQKVFIRKKMKQTLMPPARMERLTIGHFSFQLDLVGADFGDFK